MSNRSHRRRPSDLYVTPDTFKIEFVEKLVLPREGYDVFDDMLDNGTPDKIR
jgi:hypothetical protein